MKTKLRLLLLLVAQLANAYGQNSGPHVPGLVNANGTGASWANFSGLSAVDNNMMYVDLADFPICTNAFNCFVSNTAHIGNFGLAIPLNASITGLEVALLKKVGTPTNKVRDSLLALTFNGNVISNNYATSATWPLTFAYENYGSPTDLWNALLTPAIINSSTFGIDYKIANQDFSVTAQIDHATLTVYYTLPSGVHGIQSSSTSSVIPNPVVNQAAFHFSYIYPNAVLCLYNANGTLQSKTKFSGNTFEMNCNLLPPGIYFYLLEANGSVPEKGKFCVE